MKFCLRNDFHPFHKKKTAQRAVFLIWSATYRENPYFDTASFSFRYTIAI